MMKFGPLQAPSIVSQSTGSWEPYDVSTGNITLVSGFVNNGSNYTWKINPGSIWNISFTSTTSLLTTNPPSDPHYRNFIVAVYATEYLYEDLVVWFHIEKNTITVAANGLPDIGQTFAVSPTLLADDVPHLININFNAGSLTVSIDTHVVVSLVVPNFKFNPNNKAIVIGGNGTGYNSKHTINNIMIVGDMIMMNS